MPPYLTYGFLWLCFCTYKMQQVVCHLSYRTRWNQYHSLQIFQNCFVGKECMSPFIWIKQCSWWQIQSRVLCFKGHDRAALGFGFDSLKKIRTSPKEFEWKISYSWKLLHRDSSETNTYTSVYEKVRKLPL